MNITLSSLKVSNFKGIKSFEFSPGSGDALIKGRNGSGKTSIYDAFLWLLFGKNSDEKKSFGVRPVNSDSSRLDDLTVEVEAVIVFDGVAHTFKKTEEANFVKDRFDGYATNCWIDEVPKKVGEYSKSISELIPEETFKLLTNLHYFLELHWTDRRKQLIELAGEISEPEGFDELIEILNGRTVDEYKKVLAERKKLLIKERDSIPGRIDEAHRSLESYSQGRDVTELEAERDEVKVNIETLDKERKGLGLAHAKWFEQTNRLNDLLAAKRTREIELENDTSGVQVYLDERVHIKTEITKLRDVSLIVQANLETLPLPKTQDLKREIFTLQEKLSRLQSEYQPIGKDPIESVCPVCKQELPASQIEVVEQERLERRKSIAAQGNQTKAKINELEQQVEAIETEYATVKEKMAENLNTANAELEKYKLSVKQRLEELDELISQNKGVRPEDDEQWKSLCNQIEDIKQNQLVNPTEQIDEIEECRIKLQRQLDELNMSLATLDSAAKIRKRIEELKSEQANAAQNLADIEEQLAEIQAYKDAQSLAVEQAVNGMFEHLSFKLFETQVNGETKDCCTPVLNGVAYSDMSYGQKILCGVDAINTFSGFYGVQVPLFIDNAESLTLPIKPLSQEIRLLAAPGELSAVVNKAKKAVA
jgi:DNA repair protein SbcC/Rad50